MCIRDSLTAGHTAQLHAQKFPTAAGTLPPGSNPPLPSMPLPVASGVGEAQSPPRICKVKLLVRLQSCVYSSADSPTEPPQPCEAGLTALPALCGGPSMAGRNLPGANSTVFAASTGSLGYPISKHSFPASRTFPGKTASGPSSDIGKRRHIDTR